MKIGFFSPYIDSLGGGERYLLTLASHWSDKHTVDLFWDDPDALNRVEERFQIPMTRVHAVPNIFHHEPLFVKLFTTSQYDCMVFLSDGSIPTSCATHNILHFQVPFSHVSYPFWKRFKTDAIVCNSEFTKHAIDRSVGKRASVIYPPVDIDAYSLGKKEKRIITVGRFSSHFQTKKQEILIDIFRECYDAGILKGWKFILAGGMLPSDSEYFHMLEKKSSSYPIELMPNITFLNLKNEYEKALLYWHAAGFGETDPTLMEHFGISTVEAMASGCIPIVFNGGGQKEIVGEGKTGFLWNSEEECIRITERVISSPVLQKKLIKQAIQKSKEFSKYIFFDRFDQILNRISGKIKEL